MTDQEAKEIFQNKMILRVDILRNVSINYDYAKYLFNNFSAGSINSHWSYIRYNFFTVLIIDLAKLFVDSKNQKFNFFKFLVQLEKGDYKNLGILQNRIDYFRNELSKHMKLFSSIEYYRNKLFAHTEIITGINPHKLFFTQLESLINLAFEISNETSKTILNKEILNIINLTNLSDLNVL